VRGCVALGGTALPVGRTAPHGHPRPLEFVYSHP